MSSFPGKDVPNPAIVGVGMAVDPYWASLPTIPPTVGSSSVTNGDVWDASPIGAIGGRSQLAVFVEETGEGFTEDKPTNYNPDEVMGRAEPFMTWIDGGAGTFSLTFRTHAQEPGDSTPGEVNQNNLANNPVAFARWLQQLSQPLYDSAFDQVIEPPPIIIGCGRLLVARCLVTAAPIHWGGPFDPGTMDPHESTVSMTFSIMRIPSGIWDYSNFYNTQFDALSDTSSNVAPGPIPAWNRWVEFP